MASSVVLFSLFTFLFPRVSSTCKYFQFKDKTGNYSTEPLPIGHCLSSKTAAHGTHSLRIDCINHKTAQLSVYSSINCPQSSLTLRKRYDQVN